MCVGGRGDWWGGVGGWGLPGEGGSVSDEKAPCDKMEVQVLGCWWEEPEECGRKMASSNTPSVRAAETVRSLAWQSGGVRATRTSQGESVVVLKDGVRGRRHPPPQGHGARQPFPLAVVIT